MSTTTHQKPSHKILWIIAGLSLSTMIISSIALAQRIHNFNKDRDAPLYSFINVMQESMEIFGHDFDIEEITIDDKNFIRVIYANDELILPVAIEALQPLPSLFDRQKDWMAMMLMADRSGMSVKELESKILSEEIVPRLVIVTRTPFGVDSAKEKRHDSIEYEENWAWGESQRNRWLFDFYEMNPDGTITAHQPLRFPESGSSLLRRQNYAKLRGDPIPERESGEIIEYTWQYGAALKVMPRAPAITFENQALRAAGWTLPTTAASILTLIASVFFAIAPARVTKESA